ncbi:MAG: FHA domain-containing protein [Candidatus Micrarchaeota archaeon]
MSVKDLFTQKLKGVKTDEPKKPKDVKAELPLPVTEHLPFETPQGDAGKAALRPDETAVEKVAAVMEPPRAAPEAQPAPVLCAVVAPPVVSVTVHSPGLPEIVLPVTSVPTAPVAEAKPVEPTRVEEQDTCVDAGMDVGPDTGEDFAPFVGAPEPVTSTGGPVVAVYSDDTASTSEVMGPWADLIAPSAAPAAPVAAPVPQVYTPTKDEIDIVLRDINDGMTGDETYQTLRVASGKTPAEATRIISVGEREYITRTLATSAREPGALDAAFEMAIQTVCTYDRYDQASFKTCTDIQAIKTRRAEELSVLVQPLAPIEQGLAHGPVDVIDIQKQTALENAIVIIDSAVTLCNRLGHKLETDEIKSHTVEDELKSNLGVLLRNLNEPLNSMDEGLRTELEIHLYAAQTDAKKVIKLIDDFGANVDKTEVLKALAGAAVGFEAAQKRLSQEKLASMPADDLLTAAQGAGEAAAAQPDDKVLAATQPAAVPGTDVKPVASAADARAAMWENENVQPSEAPTASADGAAAQEDAPAEFVPLFGARPAVKPPAPQVTKPIDAVQIENETPEAPATQVVQNMAIAVELFAMGGNLLANGELNQSFITIGRHTRSDICLGDDKTVSRHHAMIERNSDGSVWINDNCSTTGTFVNDERVTTQRLNSGDRVRIGENIIVLNFSVPEIKAEDAKGPKTIIAVRPPALSLTSVERELVNGELFDALLANDTTKMNDAVMRGADFNAIVRGDTPLTKAVKRDDRAAVGYLLSIIGIEVDKPDEKGDAPLIHAGRLGKMEMIFQLVDSGANADYKNPKTGETAYDVAVKAKKKDATDYLRARMKVKPLQVAAPAPVVAAPAVEPVVAPAAPQRQSKIVAGIKRVRTELGIINREFIPGMKLGMSQMRDILEETGVTPEVKAVAAYVFSPITPSVTKAWAKVKGAKNKIAITAGVIVLAAYTGLAAYGIVKNWHVIKPAATSAITKVESAATTVKKTFKEFKNTLTEPKAVPVKPVEVKPVPVKDAPKAAPPADAPKAAPKVDMHEPQTEQPSGFRTRLKAK